MNRQVVGIDISKDTFNVAIYKNRVLLSEAKYDNNNQGILKFLKSICKTSMLVMEATGTYSLKLAHEADNQGFYVSVINPKQSALFSKIMQNVTKTDKKDARLLGLYGYNMQPKKWNPPSENSYKIRQHRNALKSLKKIKSIFENQLHALSVHPYPCEEVISFYKSELKKVSLQIKEKIQQITKYTKETYETQYRLLMTIKGLGKTTIPALIESTNSFQDFDSAKKYARFIGICPTYYESGTSVKKQAQICRSGDPNIRALLYVCTWSAIQYNYACKTLYERLQAKNKSNKVALMAVANKLLRQAFGVIKNGKPFNNNFEETSEVSKTTYTSKNI